MLMNSVRRHDYFDQNATTAIYDRNDAFDYCEEIGSVRSEEFYFVVEFKFTF